MQKYGDGRVALIGFPSGKAPGSAAPDASAAPHRFALSSHLLRLLLRRPCRTASPCTRACRPSLSLPAACSRQVDAADRADGHQLRGGRLRVHDVSRPPCRAVVAGTCQVPQAALPDPRALLFRSLLPAPQADVHPWCHPLQRCQDSAAGSAWYHRGRGRGAWQVRGGRAAGGRVGEQGARPSIAAEQHVVRRKS